MNIEDRLIELAAQKEREFPPNYYKPTISVATPVVSAIAEVVRAARALLDEVEGPPNEHGHRVIYNAAQPQARRALRSSLAALDGLDGGSR